LKIDWLNPVKKLTPGSQRNIGIVLSNQAGYPVDAGGKLYISYTFIKNRKDFQTSSDLIPITDQLLSPGYKKNFGINLKMPTSRGNYRLIFSIFQPPFPGTFSSPFYEVDVE